MRTPSNSLIYSKPHNSMNGPSVSALAGLFLLCHCPLNAELLPGNFWPNPSFEEGTSLGDPAGQLASWNRGGSDGSLCRVSDKAFEGSHGLAVVDEGSEFGEWYCDTSLVGRALPGDTVDLRWQEVYQTQGGEMRVSVVFLNSSGSLVGAKHFVKEGTSEGFGDALETAEWVERQEAAEVPEGAATLRVSLVSGGALTTTGIYVIDELSVARRPAPILLPGNIWTNNPTFEQGENLQLPTGVLTHWNRGGSTVGICQVTTEVSVSPSHSLTVIDTDTGYGEWYSDLVLTGLARPGDELNLQWFEMFNVAPAGEMRVSVLVLSAADAVIETRHHAVTGPSAGWAGSASASPFVRRNEKFILPEGAVKLRVSLVSGGSPETTGLLIVDDFSINVSPPALPEVLAGNVWPNPGFEEGTDLELPTGTPAGWSRGGNETSVCVTLNSKAASPTHALAVVDDTDTGYGEWYADLPLGAATAGGRLLDLQWFELFGISEGEMRLSFLFFDGANQLLGQNHFVARANSPGWQTTVADSTFTRRNEQIVVPLGAVRLQAALVSGGPATSKGVMVVDTVSIAPAPTAPQVLFGNFWSNPGFEEGTDLDNPSTGQPTGWAKGGSDVSITRVLTSAFQSTSHALAVVDESTTGYGEWYRFLDLAGVLQPGEEVALQWWEMFSVSAGGEMRLSVLFFNGDTIVGQHHFVTRGDSPGWGGTVPTSFFTKRNESLTVPATATRLLVTLTSAGPVETTGSMLVDDLSFATPLPPPDLLAGNFWINPTLEDGVQLDNPSLGLPTGWQRGGSFVSGTLVNHQLGTSPTHAIELNDTQADAYSEWYQFWAFDGRLQAGDLLDVQWFWVYDTIGDMRLSFVWYAEDNSVAGQNHFVVSGQSPDFSGELATSPFAKRSHQILVPEGAVRGLLSFASGGALSVTGRIILDDVSMRITPFVITESRRSVGGWELTWLSSPDRTYQVQSSETMAAGSFVPVPGAEFLTGEPEVATTTFTDPRANETILFYRVVRLP